MPYLFGKGTETPEDQNTTPVEAPEEEEYVPPSRYSKIPDDLVKLYPEDDLKPPYSDSDEYYDPVPVPGLVNTPGGEDSPYVLPDGETLYFFFTPDVRVPVQVQVTDEVTGIYVSHLVDGEWSEPTRILLQDPDKLAGDGCEVIIGDIMYFASVREGYTGIHWFKAELVDGEWSNWVCVDNWMKTFEYEVGELYITSDMQHMYFHSDREGSKGMRDIWVSEWTIDGWGEPEIAKQYCDKVLIRPGYTLAEMRDLGAREATGDIIVTTDADCIAPENWIEELIKPFQDPKVAAVGGAFRPLNKNPLSSFYCWCSAIMQGSFGLFQGANMAYTKKSLPSKQRLHRRKKSRGLEPKLAHQKPRKNTIPQKSLHTYRNTLQPPDRVPRRHTKRHP